MIGPKGKYCPTHVLYANHIFVFCRATKKSLTHLMEFLHIYSSILSQWMNSSRSLFLTINGSISFSSNICSNLGCRRGTIPFNYMGIPIFYGSLKREFFQPLIDRVKSKLAS